jgi:hypothetical protein
MTGRSDCVFGIADRPKTNAVSNHIYIINCVSTNKFHFEHIRGLVGSLSEGCQPMKWIYERLTLAPTPELPLKTPTNN